jgi:hypothetical protein
MRPNRLPTTFLRIYSLVNAGSQSKATRNCGFRIADLRIIKKKPMQWEQCGGRFQVQSANRNIGTEKNSAIIIPTIIGNRVAYLALYNIS